jgi:hypothetical protein
MILHNNQYVSQVRRTTREARRLAVGTDQRSEPGE